MPLDVHTTYDDATLLSLMKTGDAQAFRAIYERFWEGLFAYVYNRLQEKEISQEVVQEVFLSLWTKRESIHITTSLAAYLYGASKNGLLNSIRSAKVRKTYAANLAVFMTNQHDHSNEEWQDLRDLEDAIEESLAQLPEKCQAIFRMSRQQHIPIQNIATRLNLSTKTVENYLTQALRHLRTSLGDYLTLLFGFILYHAVYGYIV